VEWKEDAAGIVVQPKQVKLFRGSTWGAKLSQLPKEQGTVRILTYSLPRLDYVVKQIARRPRDIFMACHLKFLNEAAVLQRKFPDIQVRLHSSLHCKLVLIEPETAYLGSSNFGNSGWHEVEAGIRDKRAHDFCVEKVFNPAWEQSWPVEKCLQYVKNKGDVKRIGGWVLRS
jgi:hypothetical protein